MYTYVVLKKDGDVKQVHFYKENKLNEIIDCRRSIEPLIDFINHNREIFEQEKEFILPNSNIADKFKQKLKELDLAHIAGKVIVDNSTLAMKNSKLSERPFTIPLLNVYYCLCAHQKRPNNYAEMFKMCIDVKNSLSSKDYRRAILSDIENRKRYRMYLLSLKELRETVALVFNTRAKIKNGASTFKEMHEILSRDNKMTFYISNQLAKIYSMEQFRHIIGSRDFLSDIYNLPDYVINDRFGYIDVIDEELREVK